VLALCILGFLADEPLHAYELRARISGLTGHVRPLSDGALYPALDRLHKAGLLTRHREPGASAVPRQVLTLTDAGRQELVRRLAQPAEVEITDGSSFSTLLAFLHHLPDPADQLAVLRRRRDFLRQPASFFTERGRQLRAAELTTPFRRGIVTVAAAARRAQLAWLDETISALETALETAQT
jgi:DNA-binding PadR family transcriptional regulator